MEDDFNCLGLLELISNKLSQLPPCASNLRDDPNRTRPEPMHNMYSPTIGSEDAVNLSLCSSGYRESWQHVSLSNGGTGNFKHLRQRSGISGRRYIQSLSPSSRQLGRN
jgi:hypothetical protein